MEIKNPSELLSKHLFWDINPETLDWEINKKTIIGRVLEKGTIEEWHCIVKIYSLATITKILKNFRNLNPIDLNFIATISHTPKENFRCFNTKLLTNQHWIY